MSVTDNQHDPYDRAVEVNPVAIAAEQTPNVGTLSVVVWPTHAGAVNEFGEEPMGDPEYKRGQINWGLNEQDRIVGRTVIEVPLGNWTHIIYTHNPIEPGFVTAQKLAHPIRLGSSGTIEMLDITDEDVQPLAPDKVLHD